MQHTITWLHLSDLHACPPRSGWDARRITSTLCEDLVRLREEQDLRPDLIFFTGDAAFGQIGDKKGERIQDQFTAAHQFLTEVRHSLEPELTLRDVYIVPGNHDVNRDEVDPGQSYWMSAEDRSLDDIVGMIQGRTRQDKRQWQRFLERLEDYRAFLHDRGYHHLLRDPEGRLIFADSREIGGLRVGIAGFNSAWSCGQDREKGRLWAGGRYQLEELRSELGTVDFAVSLIHHPGNWFVEQEDPGVQRLLERDFQFVLHGHEHQDWVRCEATTGHTTVSAGACYDRSDRENGYSVVRLDRETGKGEVWLRRFDATGGGWVPREISGRTGNGCWPLEHLGPWFSRLSSRVQTEDAGNRASSRSGEVPIESSHSTTLVQDSI